MNNSAQQNKEVEMLDAWERCDYIEARDNGASHDEAMRLAQDSKAMEDFRERVY